MDADIGVALGYARMMEQDGARNVYEWAEKAPEMVLLAAEAADALVEEADQLQRAMAEHGRAQRQLAREDGYERDVWSD